jgi:uncharacterized membrane protein YhaH (DUF805 family)
MTTKTIRFCGQCGESVSQNDRFCTSCGSGLALAADSPKSSVLPPPARFEDGVASTNEYYGGMVWSDAKGSFVVPDVPSPESMNFVEAVKHCFRNYANFRGRASRSEYWYFVLLYPVALLVFVVISAFAGLYDPEQANNEASTLVALLPLATIAMVLPAMAAGVRRLHDTGRSAKWLLINIIPFGGIVILFFLCERGDDFPNRFGPP